VSMIDWRSSAVLASTTIRPLNTTTWSSWTMLNFTLTPNEGTNCANDPTPMKGTACHKNAESLCITCSGAVTFTTASAGGLQIDMGYIGPGSWNQYEGTRY
jgi:hypothetical protein